MATFVAELRRLTEYCDFGTSLEDMLHDRLVCGVNDDRIQRKLLSEPNLTFARAFKLAQDWNPLRNTLRTCNKSNRQRQSWPSRQRRRPGTWSRATAMQDYATVARADMQQVPAASDEQSATTVEKRPHCKSLPQEDRLSTLHLGRGTGRSVCYVPSHEQHCRSQATRRHSDGPGDSASHAG